MKRGVALVLVGLVVLTSGCGHIRSSKYDAYPGNPFQDVKTVAVFPFVNETPAQVDGMEFAEIFSTELVKFPGFKVIRPNIVAARAMEQNAKLDSVSDLLKFGRTLKADAVIVASITDFDPYRPPRIALSIQMFRVEHSSTARDINTMVQSATWSHRPMQLRNEDAPYVIAATEEVYDSHNSSVRDEVQAYADSQNMDDYGYINGTQFLAITTRYMQFVSGQMLIHIFDLSKKQP